MQNKINELAYKVIMLSRNNLLINLRFLDRALSEFQYGNIEEGTIFTDGKHMVYNPEYILKIYKNESEMVTRSYLHIVMHCIFRHMYISPTINRDYWDLACDIAVENIISELGISSVNVKKEQSQRAYINKVKAKVNILTAEKIYAYFESADLSESKLDDMKNAFILDDHEFWYKKEDSLAEKAGVGEDKKKSQNNNPSFGDSQSGNESSEDMSAKEASALQEKVWKDISERIQVDLETFSKQHGDRSGDLTQNLRAVNREKYDYTEFLKKFAVLGESMTINDDEFDYIFYTYGLKLYEKVPLIEPLEYKEVKRIKEFVIAIDTSGSTSGELVQKFIQKTYNVLKSTESFFSKVNIHIIQCDTEIQEDKKITNDEELEEYIKNMKILGLGGTDFRPVFTYVDELIHKKEFENLKGLIYFTDGFGYFPNKKPDYDTAFVYIDDEYNNPDVPPWAIKLVLQRDEI